MNKFRLSLYLFLILGVSFLQARVIPNIPNTTAPSPVVLKAIQVKSHKVNTEIKNGIATTSIESVFYNPNNRVLEGTYLFALPQGASISGFSLWIEGKEMPAELLNAQKAEKIYLDIVRRMVDPALLEFVGRETFKMRIFPLPAMGSRQIKLTYQQVLQTENGLMRYEYPLTSVSNGYDDVIGELSWNIKVSSDIALKSVFSPTHNVKVVKENNSATVSFQGNNVPTNRDFVLYISNSNKKVDLSLVPFSKGSGDGYFMMMLSPQVKVDKEDINPKDVVFVLDTSGSMIGDKMEQAKNALKYSLQQLNSKDNFNIIPFSTEANPYQDKLINASKENIDKALEYVEEDIYARGGTNIYEALSYALKMSSGDKNRPYMVIFMTDGKPTIGVIDTEQIIKQDSQAKIENLRLFTFGIGERLNTKLLDRLSEENKGAREYVGPKEDIEVKISNFVDKISFPVLSNIEIEFPKTEDVRITEIYPKQIPDLFKGTQITLLGRYKGNGDQAIRLKGFIGGKNQEFVYEVNFPEKNEDNTDLPRLWSIRKVGYLLDQIRLHGENKELKEEVVRLAKKYGIITPYTSYLVVEDETPTTVTRPEPPRLFDRREETAGRTFSEKTSAPGVEDLVAESGERAVEASKKIQKMRDSRTAYEADDEAFAGKENKNENQRKDYRQRSQVRKISYKTFYLNGKVWYDSESLEKKAQKLKKVRIKYLSTEYLKLLRKNPKMGKFLALGSQLQLVWEGTLYEIYLPKK